jgi:hypothetical protein
MRRRAEEIVGGGEAVRAPTQRRDRPGGTAAREVGAWQGRGSRNAHVRKHHVLVGHGARTHERTSKQTRAASTWVLGSRETNARVDRGWWGIA